MRPPGLLAALALAAGAFAHMSAAPALAQGAGSASTIVLRLPPSPRGFALGAAMAAVADPFALEFNPAVISGAGARGAASFQALPMDVAAGAAVLGFRAPGGGAAVSLRFVDYGEIEVVEPDPGLPTGTPTGATATGGELTASLGYAARVGPIRLGAAGRWLRLDVAGLTDDAFAADVGAFLEAAPGLAFGAAAQNLGPAVEAGRPAPLPLTLRVGARLDRRVGALDAMLAVEARRREERNGLGVGLEVGGGGPALRAEGRLGYESRAASGDAYAALVFGAGARVDRLSVDFAYRALGPLGSTRQFGVSFAF